jgi:hypothetical protein
LSARRAAVFNDKGKLEENWAAATHFSGGRFQVVVFICFFVIFLGLGWFFSN